ncbi:Amine oxidase [Coniochaeta hoffmannii]|uniref:Amine oxidase n=1 Tax=Coniochaeta hoffmannii TaxID=91930 RepID=A0AA38VDD9_9PEZI|nr:Amine oxidase [Coniochaeta hoffmannii]
MALPGDRQRRKKVAIVGSGAAGIAALWALNRTHHDVYLYEASGRLGGHTNTVEWRAGKYKTLVDMGFTIMNTATYPNFLNFLKRVHVETAPTEMTLGISRDQGILEWAENTLDTTFCQPRNLLSPRMWRLVFDTVRFRHFAVDVLMSEDIKSRSVGSTGIQHRASTEGTIRQYLEREGYSNAFRDDYIIPITAAIWSTSPDMCSLEIPAATLIRLMWSLGLLSTISSRPQWLTIPAGSRVYIDAVMRGFPSNHRFLNTAVRAVSNDEDGRVRLSLEGDRSETYDHVILATQGDEAYSIIQGSATPEEKRILSRLRPSTNTAILHADVSLMPRSRKAWSSWNCVTQSSSGTSQRNIGRVSVTYNMNMLQQIPKELFGNVFVTLNPLHEPDPRTVQGRYDYRQPLYDSDTIRTQQMLARIQNEHLGARVPFRLEEPRCERGKDPKRVFAEMALRLLILVVQVFLIGVIAWAVESYRAKTMRRSLRVNGLSGLVKRKPC